MSDAARARRAPKHWFSLSATRPLHFGRAMLLALATLLTTGAAWLTVIAPARHSVNTRAVEVWDTVAVWGPQTFTTPNGSLTTHIELITLTPNPDARYELKVEKGNADGTNRPTGGQIFFNNTLITGSEAIAGGTVVYPAVEPVDTNHVKVTVSGPAGALFRVTLLSQPNKSYKIFGPEQYLRGSGEAAWQTDTFIRLPSAKGPYHIYVVNGNSNGTDRVDSARIQINATTVVDKTTLNKDAGSRVRTVTLADTNVIRSLLKGPSTGKITVRVTATDSTAPTLT